MATKPEIEAHTARKLRQVLKEELTGAYVKSAVAGTMDAAAWNQIATWLKNGQEAEVGKFVRDKVAQKIIADSNSEAATMWAANTITLANYARAEKL